MATIAGLPKQPGQRSRPFSAPTQTKIPSAGTGQPRQGTTGLLGVGRQPPAPGPMPGQQGGQQGGGPIQFDTMDAWRDAMQKAGAPYLPGSEQLELEARDPNAAYQRSQQMSDFRRNNPDLWRARPGFTPGQGAVPNVNPDAVYSPEEAKYGQRTQGVEKFIRAWQLDPRAWEGAPQEVLTLRDKIMAGPLPSLNKGKSGLANTAGNQWVVNPAWMKANWGNAEANRFDDSRYWKDGGTGAARELTEPGRAATAHRNARNSAFEQWTPYSPQADTPTGGAGIASVQQPDAPGPIPGAGNPPAQTQRRGAEEMLQGQSGGGTATPDAKKTLGEQIYDYRHSDPNRGKPGYIWNGRDYIYDPTADPSSEVSRFIANNRQATMGDVNRRFPGLNPPNNDMSSYGGFRMAPGPSSGGGDPPADNGGGGGGNPPAGGQSQARSQFLSMPYNGGQTNAASFLPMLASAMGGPSTMQFAQPSGAMDYGFDNPMYATGGGGQMATPQMSMADIGMILQSMDDSDPLKRLLAQQLGVL